MSNKFKLSKLCLFYVFTMSSLIKVTWKRKNLCYKLNEFYINKHTQTVVTS